MTEAQKRRRRRAGKLARLLDREMLWSIAALVVLTLAVGGQLSTRTYDYAPGDIVDRDVIAPVDLSVPDPDSTSARRDNARSAVLDVYDFDPFAWRAPVDSLNTLFAWGRALRETNDRPWTELDAGEQDLIVAQAESMAGVALPDAFVSLAWDERFAAAAELEAERVLRGQLQLSLVGSTVTLGGSARRGLLVRDIVTQEESVLPQADELIELETARTRAHRELRGSGHMSPILADALGELLGIFMRPNLTYNSNETQFRRQEAESAVEPVFYQVRRGRAIVREGDPVTPQVARELGALREQWSAGRSQGSSFGVAILVGLTILGLWRYTELQRQSSAQRVRRLYLLVLLVLVASALLMRLLLFVGDAVAGTFAGPPYNMAESYAFAVPFAFGSLLLVLLADVNVACMYGALQATLVGAMTNDVRVALFAALGSFAVAFGMSRFSQRTAMLRVVVWGGAVNVLVVLGFSFLAQPAQVPSLTVFQAGLAATSAVQSVLLASALLPVLEWLFNTLTDIKLLELSNMNLPLLKQLAVAAPGTYHHSVVIGTLAEKASEDIGANPLFSRVAAYYHDIGKMRQPEYFVENQKDGRNPHDKISPHMSALVLIRHVKDGVTYAEEQRLPQPLIDVIPQHHGTSLMRFFYDRALKSRDNENVPVREEDFRYPGPKPQSKEAALIMLADGVEAMSRLIDDPTPVALRQMIRRNIKHVLDDGQLDECDLTLADLATVEEAFLDVLSGMHHQRIEYPADESAAEAAEPVEQVKP